MVPNEEALLDQYYCLATGCVSRYKYSSDYDDILQEALLGLLLAIRTYKDTHNCSFKTFAYICINSRIKTYYSSKVQYVPLTDECSFVINNINEILPDSLSNIDREIIYFRLYNYTFREISLFYNIGINTIKSKYRKTIKQIRASNNYA